MKKKSLLQKGKKVVKRFFSVKSEVAKRVKNNKGKKTIKTIAVEAGNAVNNRKAALRGVGSTVAVYGLKKSYDKAKAKEKAYDKYEIKVKRSK